MMLSQAGSAMTRLLLGLLAVGLLGTLALLPVDQVKAEGPADTADTSQLDQLLRQVQSNPRNESEANVLKMLEQAEKAHRSYAASLALRNYLTYHPKSSPALLLSAAENARQVGDFRTAVARYKSYLAVAGNQKQAPEAAARLYQVQVQFLSADEDAYETMKQHGTRFRDSQTVQLFDGWFLQQAREREDYVGLATRLADIFEEKHPIEFEKFNYWDNLDWLTEKLSETGQAQMQAMAEAQRLAKSIREDERRAEKLRFRAAYLAFMASREGKSDEELAKAFQLVDDAARRYLKADSTFRTFRDIAIVLAGGDGNRFDGNHWRLAQSARESLMHDLFALLPAEDQQQVMDLRFHYSGFASERIMSRPQWAELIKRFAKNTVQADIRHRLEFLTGEEKPEEIRSLHQAVAEVPSRDAAIVRSFVAGDGDWAKTLKHLAENESWHLNPSDFDWIIRDRLQRYITQANGWDEKKGEAEYRQAWITFGRNYLSKSPIAVWDTDAAENYLETAFNHLHEDGKDKSGYAELVLAFEWVPYNRDQAREVFNQAYGSYRNWARDVRQQFERDKKPLPEAIQQQITAIDEAFNKVREGGSGDVAKAPTEAMRDFARLLAADRDGNDKAEAQLKACEALLSRVGVPGQDRQPFAESLFNYAFASRKHIDKHYDLQLKVIGQALAAIKNRSDELMVDELINRVVSDQWGMSFWRTDKRVKDKMLRLHVVIAAELRERLKKGEFSEQFFSWYRGTVMGNQWRDTEISIDVIDTIVQNQLFKKNGWYMDYHVNGYTTSQMYLVDREFDPLEKKYPPRQWFEQRFIAESHERDYLDHHYFDFSDDPERKVRDAATEILAGYTKLPIWDKGNRDRAYSWGELKEWHDRVGGASNDKRQALLDKLSQYYGKTRFDAYARGRQRMDWQSNLDNKQERETYFKDMAEYLAATRHTSLRDWTPYLAGLRDVRGEDASSSEIDAVLSLITVAPTWWDGRGHEDEAGRLVVEGLVAQERWGELQEALPYLWRMVAMNGAEQTAARLADASQKAGENSLYDLSFVIAQMGLDMAGARLNSDSKAALLASRAKALSSIGGIIPVDESDPRYPVFAAQAAYVTGRLQTAWEGYVKNRSLIETNYKELDPTFTLWLIRRNIETGQFDRARTMIQQMTQWTENQDAGFEPQIRASLVLAYGDLALAQEDLIRARAWYARVASSEEYEGTRAHNDAQLQVANVDRLSRNYDQAERQLNRLTRSKDDYLRVEANYLMALTKFDQSQFESASDFLDKVFARRPDHPDGRILEGRLNLQLKKLEESTDVNVGTVTRRRLIVPGRPLNVELEDRNLAVVGKATNVELRAWTSRGDEELFNLVPFGDSRTKFQGQIGTELGPLAKGDGRLQLFGNDRVYYAFSDKFREANNLDEAEPFELSVATDATLLSSSGRILTKEELAEIALEEQIRERIGQGEDPEQQQGALSTRRSARQVKPGNSINVRVIDPDRNTSDERDRISIKLTTSSGDRIDSFPLVETDTHSGIFEAAVPTASAQAVAFATDSNTGRDPNNAISAGDYAAWEAIPDSVKPKFFAIDLNESLNLGTMTIHSNTAGRRIKDLFIQTSLNGRQFETVGHWPSDLSAWDGSPQVEIVKYRTERTVSSKLTDLLEYFDHGYRTLGHEKVAMKTDDLSDSFDNGVKGKAGALKLENSSERGRYIARYRAVIMQPRRQIRTFELENRKKSEWAQYYVSINGDFQTDGQKWEGTLPQGPVVIEVYMLSNRREDPSFRVLWDTEKEPFREPIPAEAFKNQEAQQAVAGRQRMAKLKTTEQGNIEVTFAKDTQARVVRLLMTDYETDAPAIEKIELIDAQGNRVLPTASDYRKLRDNETLEIVPGDKVTVLYDDPQTISEGSELHEAALNVTYHNAVLSAAFVEYSTRGAERVPYYIAMRRFEPGDAVVVFINDADLDTSDQLDLAEFTVKTSTGEPVTLKAKETAEHSGVFEARIFPVEGEPTRPEEIQVKPGADIELRYLDKENTDPGVAIDRVARIEQVWWEQPKLRVYGVESQTIEGAQNQQQPELETLTGEYVPSTRRLVVTRPTDDSMMEIMPLLLDGPLVVEVTHKASAKSVASKVEVFAQTSSGRAKAANGENNQQGKDAFDPEVPGTVRVQVGPGDMRGIEVPEGYRQAVVTGNRGGGSALEDGRFVANIPMALGKVPDKSLIDENADQTPGAVATPLAVRGGDKVYVGFRFTDPTGKVHWVVREAQLGSDAMFHVMDRRYQQLVDEAYIGETIYFRVIHPGADQTDQNDRVSIDLKTSSGKTTKVELTETLAHSGIFKGLVKLAYFEDQSEVDKATTFGINYGDEIEIAYQPSGLPERILHRVNVFKGSDGSVVPFTKRFKDPELAVETQFTIAEAHFELAKRHRELGEQELAREGIADGEKLLNEAVRDFPNTELRAQAEYLLAELAMEVGDDTKDEKDQRSQYLQALGRFNDILASYPDSPYAPKAQFKKALVFEKLGEVDRASEEYVKLSYRYPDHELVANTIQRLGFYFLNKGRDMRAKADATEDPVEAEKIRMQSRKMLKTAGEVLGRLSERFPSHQLAAETKIAAGKCFVQAEAFKEAVEVFEAISRNEDYDKELLAESMYWLGVTHMKKPEPDYPRAYRAFKMLEWSYPASKWAKWARAQLLEPELMKIGAKEAQ